jgi:glutamine amidotransferase
MCRHVAYLGAPLPLGAVLTEPEHSLVRQAKHAQFQTSGHENPDGWGVGWHDRAGSVRRHRSATPIWLDPELGEVTTIVTDNAVAAVRLASPGSRIEATSNAPFVADDRWLFSLNGVVDGFHDGVGEELRALVTPSRRVTIEGGSDSEVLFALVLDQLDRGCPAIEAMATVIASVEARTTGRLNLLLSAPGVVVASAVGNSLFTCGATLVASEPLNDAPEWERVPDRSLVDRDGTALSVVPL